MNTELALPKNLNDVVAEYDQKIATVSNTVKAFEAAGNALKTASTIGGVWADVRIDTGSVYDRQILESLLKSAWKHVYSGLQIERIASAKDKKRWEQSLANPPPFTLDNIRATFGDFILNPRLNILRGLAEVFCDLDPAYKSHDKVRIGVKGLPKRIILSYLTSYGWGRDRLGNVLNALAAYQGKPLVTWSDIDAILKDEDALKASHGVHLKRFGNGNGHLHFEPDTLRDINMALAEFYGDVLADDSEEKPAQHAAGTSVSKDLQYYPTPTPIVERIVESLYGLKAQRILEPSCGCGRFLDALRGAGANVFGIEYDAERANTARGKGHKVLTANFLETVPTADYDRVVMNPPFYGKHYAKHVKHAMEFLKPEGTLTAILPATARYDHGLLDGRWEDLPVGSFSESGTNINTTVLTMFR
jgi:Domain of unknown function (DUF4942)/Uncharacterised methyltransferase family (DUF6094)